MPSFWQDFDETTLKQDEFNREHALADFALTVRSKGTFMVAYSLGHMIDNMLLLGRTADAQRYAQLTAKYGHEAIKRGHTFLGARPGLTANMSQYIMWHMIYKSRWLLNGVEDDTILNIMLELVVADIGEGYLRGGKQSKRYCFGELARTAARLGQFDLAARYAADLGAPLDWSHGATDEMCDRLLARFIDYKVKHRKSDEARGVLVRDYTELLDKFRSGIFQFPSGVQMQAALNVVYFGFKHLEEVRQGRAFTYSELVRSIRYVGEN